MSGTSPPRGDRASYVSANEVAERAGVSRSAVSRTFSGAGSVAPATRRKVLKAAEELGYHANLLARGLVGEPSKIVCLIAADVGQPYHAVMIDKVTRQLQEHGKVSMIINTSGDEESVSQALRQSLQYRAEASVVLSGSPSAKLVQSCLANGQRVVLVNRSDDSEGVERLWIDNRKACRDRADDCQDGIDLPETHCHRSDKARSQNSVIGIRDATPGAFHSYISADDFLDLASGAFSVIDEDRLACNYGKWRRFLAKNFVVVEHVEQGNTQA